MIDRDPTRIYIGDDRHGRPQYKERAVYRTWTPPGSEEARGYLDVALVADKYKAQRQRGRRCPPRTRRDSYPSSASDRGMRRLYGGTLGQPRTQGQRHWAEILCPDMGTSFDRSTKAMVKAATGSTDTEGMDIDEALSHDNNKGEQL